MKGINDLDPGDVVVAEPVDGVTLEIHGLADKRGPMIIKADVDRHGLYLYDIINVNEEAGKFVAEAERHTHTKAEEAIREIGGVVA